MNSFRNRFESLPTRNSSPPLHQANTNRRFKLREPHQVRGSITRIGSSHIYLSGSCHLCYNLLPYMKTVKKVVNPPPSPNGLFASVFWKYLEISKYLMDWIVYPCRNSTKNCILFCLRALSLKVLKCYRTMQRYFFYKLFKLKVKTLSVTYSVLSLKAPSATRLPAHYAPSAARLPSHYAPSASRLPAHYVPFSSYSTNRYVLHRSECLVNSSYIDLQCAIELR